MCWINMKLLPHHQGILHRHAILRPMLSCHISLASTRTLAHGHICLRHSDGTQASHEGDVLSRAAGPGHGNDGHVGLWGCFRITAHDKAHAGWLPHSALSRRSRVSGVHTCSARELTYVQDCALCRRSLYGDVHSVSHMQAGADIKTAEGACQVQDPGWIAWSMLGVSACHI